MSGERIEPTTSHRSVNWGKLAVRSDSGNRAYRHTHVPSSRCSALCRIPRLSEDSERVGLYSIVLANSSSKLSKDSGPLTKSAITLDLSASTPGVTSTSTTARTRSGA